VPNTSDPRVSATIPDTAAVMTVVVRNPRGEVCGGPPCIQVVTVSAFCPYCAQRRGTPELVGCRCGEHECWVDVWHNECGHADNWESILDEAAQQCARPDCVLLCSTEHYPYCSPECAVLTPAVLDYYRVLRSYLHRTCPTLTHVPTCCDEPL